MLLTAIRTGLALGVLVQFTILIVDIIMYNIYFLRLQVRTPNPLRCEMQYSANSKYHSLPARLPYSISSARWHLDEGLRVFYSAAVPCTGNNI